MRQPAASLIGRRRIYGGVAAFNVGDLSVFTHNVSRAVAHAVGAQHAVRFGCLPGTEIAQEWELQFELFGKNLLGGSVIRTDAYYRSVIALEFRITSLVCREFLGSTTGESGGEKCHNYRLFSFEIVQRNLAALGGRKRKIGRNVADLQRRRVTHLRRRLRD